MYDIGLVLQLYAVAFFIIIGTSKPQAKELCGAKIYKDNGCINNFLVQPLKVGWRSSQPNWQQTSIGWNNDLDNKPSFEPIMTWSTDRYKRSRGVKRKPSCIHRDKTDHSNHSRKCWPRWNHAGWRHEMETFSTLLALCARNSSVTGESPSQWPVTRSFDVFIYLRLNKWLSKQWTHRLFETTLR